MKTLALVFSLILGSSALAQNSPKFNYDGGYYAQIDKKNQTISYLQFSVSDSIYTIYFEGKNGELVAFQNRYIGTYTMDSVGNIRLRGKHPFQQSQFLIHHVVSDCNDMERSWGYSKKLDLSFDAQIIPELSTKRKGDQMHLLNTRYQSANSPDTHFYGSQGMGFFQPTLAQVFRETSKQDSLFNTILSQQQLTAYLAGNTQIQTSTLNTGESFAFWVDSIRFDTLYINKLYLVTKKKEFSFRADTIPLNQTVKVQLKYGSTSMYLPEHTELFNEHEYASEVIYDVQEIDRTEQFTIIDYYLDDAGIQWIKIQLDMWVTDDELYTTKLEHFEGWMLQRQLHIY